MGMGVYGWDGRIDTRARTGAAPQLQAAAVRVLCRALLSQAADLFDK
jgi:hypothetical protein